MDKTTELKTKIAKLPKGKIYFKSIKGKKYPYHRGTENGTRFERYVNEDELPFLQSQIDLRIKLEKELREIEIQNNTASDKLIFNCSVLIGNSLSKYVNSVKRLKKRFCFKELTDYLYSDIEKVFILYGLRRTGKTTMIRQAILDMNEDDFNKAAFIQIKPTDTMASLNRDLQWLESNNYQFIFIDEITAMEDFIEGAALLSDVFALSGMKIVLSGTDSLGFMLSASEQLYDRCIMLHTTFISFKEFYHILGIHDIDEYIQYGGTMSISGINYNQSTFANEKSVNEYVDTAIAKNIQHSLNCYEYGTHFRHLQELYDNNELTNAIQRVIEDINHRFTVATITKKFKSSDLSISTKIIRKTHDVLDNIDRESVEDYLKGVLEIKEADAQYVDVENIHAQEIKEYLSILDLIHDIEIVSIPLTNQNQSYTIISQPGMRYCQANVLIEGLLQDPSFSEFTKIEKENVIQRILTEVKGRMLEDIILLETKIAKPDKEVFKLKFFIGEFDMVVYDPKTISCELYEIKHSKKQVNEQFKHLIDSEKLKLTEHNYGTITSRTVLYRGENTSVGDIKYQNIEQYLLSL